MQKFLAPWPMKWVDFHILQAYQSKITSSIKLDFFYEMLYTTHIQYMLMTGHFLGLELS